MLENQMTSKSAAMKTLCCKMSHFCKNIDCDLAGSPAAAAAPTSLKTCPGRSVEGRERNAVAAAEDAHADWAAAAAVVVVAAVVVAEKLKKKKKVKQSISQTVKPNR